MKKQQQNIQSDSGYRKKNEIKEKYKMKENSNEKDSLVMALNMV